MATEFLDVDGTTRLSGELVIPGATPGDVLTVQDDESVAPAPGGGSQPGGVRFVLLDEVTAADVADDKLLVYSLADGERLIAGGVVAVTAPDDGQLVIGVPVDDADPFNTGSYWVADDGHCTSSFGPDPLFPPVVGPTDVYASGAQGAAPPFGAWQANHLYNGTFYQAVVAEGHAWINTGSAGTSGGSEPDFAGNIGGTVADGPNIVWTDDGALPTTGALTGFLLIASALS